MGTVDDAGDEMASRDGAGQWKLPFPVRGDSVGVVVTVWRRVFPPSMG